MQENLEQLLSVRHISYVSDVCQNMLEASALPTHLHIDTDGLLVHVRKEGKEKKKKGQANVNSR